MNGGFESENPLKMEVLVGGMMENPRMNGGFRSEKHISAKMIFFPSMAKT